MNNTFSSIYLYTYIKIFSSHFEKKKNIYLPTQKYQFLKLLSEQLKQTQLK